jgi:PAS domain S-box-containing protein
LGKAISGHNSTEELLPESEELTRAIVAAALDAIVVVDHEGHILEFNPAAERLFGYRREDVLGRELADTIIPPSLRQQHRRELAHFLATGERPIVGKRVEVTRMRADGSELLVELSLTRTGLRTPVFLGFMRDITERKRTEEALRESEERFRTMADGAAVMIWTSGPDKLCTWVNMQWLTFVGHTMAQELGNGWAENIHPEDFDRCLQTYSKRFDAREPFSIEYRLRRHDGQWRWILDNGVPRYDAHKNFAGYIGSCIDVTEAKRVDQRDQELAVLFDHSPDSLARFDSNIRATHVNSAFENAAGISSKDIVGKRVRELPVPKDTAEAVESAVRSVFTTRQPCTAYFSCPSPRGIREFEVRYIPEFAADQSIAAVFSIARDITEQKALEELAAAKERDIRALTARLITSQEQERRRIARDIHDSLCQHLGALAAEIAESAADVPASGPARQRLQAARKRALDIADEARQVARQLHPSILEDLGLPKALRSLCDEFRQREGIRVKLQVLDHRRQIPIEAASCVYRVTQEAFNNITKHAGAKNVAVLLSVRRALHFSIRDDGVGFDPRAAQDAGGLGLVSMRERARLANGELSVESKPGHGTRVKLVVSLPGNAS